MKYEFRPFHFGVFDYKEAEKLLNQMVEKGYVFKGTGKGWIKGFAMFEKIQSTKKLRYAVDINCEDREKELNNYYSFYEDFGWQKVDCFQKKLHIFVSEKEEVLPIYTDAATEFENLKGAVRLEGQIALTAILVSVFIALAAFMIYIGGIRDNRLISYIIIVLCFLMAGCSLTNLINNILYMNQCRTNVEMRLTIPENILLKKMRFAENIFRIIFFISLPIVAINGYAYEIWGKGSQTELYMGSAFTLILFIACILSVPVLLFSTYKLFMKPYNANFKVLSYIGYSMYYMSIFMYFSDYISN